MDCENLCTLSKKTYYLNYAGKLYFHPVYVSSMSKWMIASVNLLQNSSFCSLVIDHDGISTKEEPKTLIDLQSQLQKESISNIQKNFPVQKAPVIKSSNESQTTLYDTANSSTEALPFHVSYNQVVEVLTPNDFEKKCFAFIVHQGNNCPLILHVYRDDNEQLVKEVGETIQHFMTWNENPSNKDGNSFVRHLKLEDLESIKFEVLLLGKIQVNSDIPRNVVVDEAVDKYLWLKKEHCSNQNKNRFDDADAAKHSASTTFKKLEEPIDLLSKEENSPLINKIPVDSIKPNNQTNPESTKSSGTSVNLAFDKNKTKIIQVGKQSIILISPDQSFQDIDIPFSQVASCERGRRYKDHFGIFLKDVSYSNIGSLKKKPKTDNKPRCYILKCSERNVCSEIIQAIRQACSSCVYGPDPLCLFHSLCKRIRTLSSNDERSSPETGIDLVASFIAEVFTEQEHTKVKQLISDTCKKTPPKSTFEHLVVIIEMVRQIFEERQYAHEMKIKALMESPNSSQSLGVGKQFNLFNEKARRSFGNLVNLFEKYHINSSSPSSGSSSSNRKNTPPNNSSDASSEDYDVTNSPDWHRAHASTLSAETGSIGRIRRRTGGPEGRLSPVGLVAPTSSANPKKRSFSSPFLHRLIPTLPDLKESPSEGENPASFKSSRFSFSRLFRGTPVCSQPIELEDLAEKPGKNGFGDFKEKEDDKMIKNPSKNLLLESHRSLDLSSDEDDNGIYFSAKPGTENELSNSCSIQGTSSQEASAFTPVTPQKNIDPSCSNPPASKHGLVDGVAHGGLSFNHPMSPLDFVDNDVTGPPPNMQRTIHHRIFNMIGTNRADPKTDEGPLVLSDFKRTDSLLETPAEIKSAWKCAIEDQMTLNKIQKSPPPLRGTSCETGNCAEQKEFHDEMHCLWLNMIQSEKQKVNCRILLAAVKREVPVDLRGKIWKYLCMQWKLREECCCYCKSSGSTNLKLPNKSYDSLLKELTTHQHAILIDLADASTNTGPSPRDVAVSTGRTFPTHPYFSRQMGNGQLALFNLLKAYSLVDEGVGYCQGLSFVAGILLINLSDAGDAFDLLCHLMVRMNCRKFYLPDMAALRVAVYQLSRLLYDFHSDLWHHLEKNEVTLMLFSTPWFLTMFASVLSLDFTARIFDLLFIEGSSALFKTALCLLGCHKKKLLLEDGFENVMNYLKQNLPNMDAQQIESVTTEMFGLDIGDRLGTYEAEYNVIEESNLLNNDVEIAYKEHIQLLNRKCANYSVTIRQIEKQNVDLIDQLNAANRQIESLRQGLSDFAGLDQQRKRQVEALRKENHSLKKASLH